MEAARHPWTEAEDDQLTELVQKYGHKWVIISKEMENRSPSQVESRWEKCINPELKKGAFTPEEDDLIRSHVQQYGASNWPKLKELLPNRSPKQCRERWYHHLDPRISNSAWTFEEDQKIFHMHENLHLKWTMIAKYLRGRTDNAIKNRYNTSIKKRIVIDPNGQKLLSKELDKEEEQQKKKARNQLTVKTKNRKHNRQRNILIPILPPSSIILQPTQNLPSVINPPSNYLIPLPQPNFYALTNIAFSIVPPPQGPPPDPKPNQ